MGQKEWIPEYPESKDTFKERLGEIPSHWGIRKLKQLSSVVFSSVDKKISDEEQPVRLCNYTDVYNNESIKDDLDFLDASATYSEIEKFSLKKDDVVVTKDSESWEDIAVPAYVIDNLPGVLCGYHLAIIRPEISLIAGKFLFWCFKSCGLSYQFRRAANGITRYGLSNNSLVSSLFPVPPIVEQRNIVSFLDQETAKIDVLIAKKERLIELSKEKRTALITRAVTNGLDPNVPMKDSGVDWLGQIPTHWSVWKATHGFTCIGSGTTPNSDVLEYYNGDIPWVTTTELRESVICDTNKKVTDKALKDYPSLKVYPAGTLLVAMYGATIGRLGLLGIPASVNQACCAFCLPKVFHTKFFYYWLFYRRPIIISLSEGGGQPNLSQQDLRELRIPIPPKDEQGAIADFLDTEISEIDKQVAKVVEGIERIKEFRTALISSAVTGKIDVRGEVA